MRVFVSWLVRENIAKLHDISCFYRSPPCYLPFGEYLYGWVGRVWDGPVGEQPLRAAQLLLDQGAGQRRRGHRSSLHRHGRGLRTGSQTFLLLLQFWGSCLNVFDLHQHLLLNVYSICDICHQPGLKALEQLKLLTIRDFFFSWRKVFLVHSVQ